MDAGWGLFAARDFKRDELVLDYRFVDGRRGIEVDRLDASQLEARYPDPLHPPTHVLRPHGSGISWDTLRCRGVGGFANSHTGHQNCLFRGSKIHMGSRGQKAGTELFLNYSYDHSYEWADEPEPEADFHHHPLDFSFCRPGTGGADVSVTATARLATAAGPTSPTVRRSPPWDRLLQRLEEGSPPQPSLPVVNTPSPPRQGITHLEPPPPRVRLPRVRKTPAVGSRRSRRHAPPTAVRLPLPSLPEDTEALPDASSGDLSAPMPTNEIVPSNPAPHPEVPHPPFPQVTASVGAAPRPTQGVICFQRSRPGAWSPEILVHVDTGSTSFSGLPLAPPSVNGWSSRSVTKSLKGFVAITPRVRQCLHRAVDRNPWGQVSEPSTALLRGMVRSDVAVWVVNLTAAASADLLDCKDSTECDSDCRWIPSTTALAVDWHGGLRLAQVAAALQSPAKVARPPARRRPRVSRPHRSGRFGYDQAMKLPCTDRCAYNSVMRVYTVRRAPTPAPPTRWLPPDYPAHAPPVLLPHLAVTPLWIANWHARMESIPPIPRVPTLAVAAALVNEQRLASAFASTTPTSPAPTVVDILREAGRRARSRGASQVTPLDVRHAAQLFAPPRASLKPRAPFVDPIPENADDLHLLSEAIKHTIDSSGNRRPRVLSVCDTTAIVANAFRRAGCDVVSIDRMPSEDPTMPHIIGDASDFLDAGFDLVVGQPPCTFLCNAGVVWLHRDPNRYVDMHHAAKFFKRILDAQAPFVAAENPAMHRYGTAAIGGLRPSQYVHPFDQGHGETKSIGIYSTGLPRLVATKLVAGRAHSRAALPQSPERGAIRGRTYLGVAAAMATQWTGVVAQYVAEQTEGLRHRTNGSSAFELCVAVASRLERPLTIHCERTDGEGNVHAARMMVPEDFVETDADFVAAALAAHQDPFDKNPVEREAIWKCEHGIGHVLAPNGLSADVCHHSHCRSALETARALIEATPPQPLAVTFNSSPLSTSMVSSITHVRRPSPAEVPPDTRIRRLHLRKGAWWAWSPGHDPADDHLYHWLRLDEEMQQQLSIRLARLEVPQSLAEEPLEDPKSTSEKAWKYPTSEGFVLNPVAAIRDSPSAGRRLFAPQRRPKLNLITAAPRAADVSEEELEAARSLAEAARERVFLTDPLCVQTYAVCTTCGATRTYAPKGKLQRPNEYADQPAAECRRGVGATCCDREEPAGGPLTRDLLCAPLNLAVALRQQVNPFIQFHAAAEDIPVAVVGAVSPLAAPQPLRNRVTPMRVVLHLQRECRRRLVLRHGAARALQTAFRTLLLTKYAAAMVLQRFMRSRMMLPAVPSFTTLGNVTLPRSQIRDESDTFSDTAVFGGRQPFAAQDSQILAEPDTGSDATDVGGRRRVAATADKRGWQPLQRVVASLANSAALDVTLSTSRPPSCDASEAGPDFLTFDEEDIAGDATKDNPLAYCAYLKNVRIAQRWEDGKKRRYRLNSACCWIRSSIADSGAGPSVIGNNLMHALPPDAVVNHNPRAPRMGPVIGPSGERLLMLGTVTIVFAVEGRPYTHNFQVVEGGDLFILGNDFLAEHGANVETHLASDPVEGFVELKHRWGDFRAALVNDPNRHAVAAPVVTRPPVAATAGASLAALVAVVMAGAPPALSEARQLANTSKLPFHISKPITPSDLADFSPGLSVRGGVTDTERQPKNPARMAALKAVLERESAREELPHGSLVASVSGHPTSVFGLADTETAAKSLSHVESHDILPPPAAGPESGVVTESDPTLAAAMPDDDTAAADDDDDDGLEHPSDNAPIVAPPKDYRFSPWEELKTHENLLYSESAIEVREKTTVTIRLKVPSRLHGYAGPVEVSACAIRHRLDHGLDVPRTIGYVDPEDHTVPLQITNFTHRKRSIGSLIPVCQIAFDSVVVHDKRSSPEDTTWKRLPPKTRRALEKISIDESGLLSPERRARALDLVARHHAAFSTDSKVPGATHLLEVAIDLKPGALPFRHAPSRTGTVGEKIIDDAVSEMETHGIIRKSTSQWASRVVLVSKKSSPDPRFCVDLRDLNSRLVVLDTPLPRCDDAIDRLGVASERKSSPGGTPGAPPGNSSGSTTGSPGLAGTTGTDAIDAAPRALKILSKNLLYHTLDLTAGFWNLPVKESHRDRLAFVTSRGKWEFNVLPFGLMTGPSYMQRMIEATLVGLNWDVCLPYLDDIIIWANGDTEEEAFEQSMERLELVLERLEWAGLRAKPSKCHLFATSVDYLGHVCSRDGVSLDPKKISAVANINPRSINNLETVRSFLGLAGYYRNHIANFHVLSSPLVDLTKAGVDVPTESQKPEAQAAVVNLISALCMDPVLMYPRSDRQFIVATDAATGVGVGACLKQVDDDGVERVVSYHGRRFNKAERNYTVTECEPVGGYFSVPPRTVWIP